MNAAPSPTILGRPVRSLELLQRRELLAGRGPAGADLLEELIEVAAVAAGGAHEEPALAVLVGGVALALGAREELRLVDPEQEAERPRDEAPIGAGDRRGIDAGHGIVVGFGEIEVLRLGRDGPGRLLLGCHDEAP